MALSRCERPGAHRKAVQPGRYAITTRRNLSPLDARHSAQPPHANEMRGAVCHDGVRELAPPALDNGARAVTTKG